MAEVWPDRWDAWDATGGFSGGWNGGAPASQSGDYNPGMPGGMFGLGGVPNTTTISQAMDINPAISRGLMAGVGMLNPGLGMGLMGLNSFGNIANTASNVGMLQNMGVNPGWGSILGGAFGFNNLAGNATGALNKAMADMMPGFAGLSVAQAPGFNAPGWGDIAAAMDALGGGGGRYEGQSNAYDGDGGRGAAVEPVGIEMLGPL